MIIIPIENQHAYHNIPRNRDLKHKIDHHCNAPSRVLLVDWKGDCFVCGCEAWLPVSVGKISDFQTLASVWQNPVSLSLQADIDSRLFTHCAVDRCGVLHNNLVHDQYLVSINIDESCNLHCPSCRSGAIMMTSGVEFQRRLAQVNHIVDLLQKFDRPCRVVMSGNGDPLASAIMRPLIHRWQPNENHSVRLFTNGLLLAKQLNHSPILDHIVEYFISIDAGSAPVYERVRLGGSWDRLIENFDWLHAQQLPAQVLLMLVLQRANYRDIENFCELVIKYGWQGSITYLEDWGTWQDFDQEDVIGNPSHSEHAAAMQSLRTCWSKYHTRINFGSRLVSMISDC